MRRAREATGLLISTGVSHYAGHRAGTKVSGWAIHRHSHEEGEMSTLPYEFLVPAEQDSYQSNW